MKRNSQYKICKNDIILAAVLAAAAVVLAVVFFLIPGEKQGNTAVITIDGREYGRYSLSKDQTIEIVDDEKGKNTVIIRDNAAHMEEADCPDGYCIYRGNISRAGETIVCLPHRLVVEIISEDNTSEEFDVIAE